MQQLFQRMCALVETKAFPGLKSYRSDLYVDDHAQLRNTWTPDTRYLWVVRPNGTHLFVLGVHKSISEAAAACLKTIASGDDTHFYLLQDNGLCRISRDVALTVISKQNWTVRGEAIVDRNNVELAQFKVQAVNDLDWRKSLSVELTGRRAWQELSAHEQTVVYLCSLMEAQRDSILVNDLHQITYNGDCVYVAGTWFQTTPTEMSEEQV